MKIGLKLIETREVQKCLISHCESPKNKCKMYFEIAFVIAIVSIVIFILLIVYLCNELSSLEPLEVLERIH